MNRLARCSLALALCVAVTAPARADEDPQKAARAHYQRGLELANHGDYRAALDEFDRAYAASPNFAVLYNIGQADVALGRPEKALEALKKYLADGGEQVTPARRAQVEQQIALLESVFAELEVVTEPPGARVTVDGAELGTTPLSSAVRLTAGTHVVWVSRPGAATETRVVTLGEGQHDHLAIALPDLPPPSAPVRTPASPQVETPAPPPAAPPPAATTSTHEKPAFPVGYVLIGAGVAVGGIALTQYFWNHGRLDDFHANEAALQTDTSPGRRERQVENNELASSINGASAVTVGLGIAAGALVAGGVTWLFLQPSASGSSGRESAVSGPRSLPSVAVTHDSLRVSWSGTW
jgi:PEGA domain/Tetratricopeptide repeat